MTPMQPTTIRFHRSMYITLGLACACLGYAESQFLPEINVFVAVVGVLLAVAYALEGRWALSIKAANVLGCVIGAIAAVWVTYQLVRPYGALIDQLPSPTWLLPYLGPLLMILIPAKLFRPKHIGDFWALQGIGLIAVSLACALTADPLFGALLLAYLISGIWSLTLFYYYRQQPAGAARSAAAPRALPQAGRWSAAAITVALALFLLTPRLTEARWELASHGARLQTGVDDNRPSIDLNRSGTLAVNREKAFEVRAFTQDVPDPPPKLDLDPGQRWRQVWFDYYEAGRWDSRPYADFRLGLRGGPPGWGVRGLEGPREQPAKLPDLGPGQFYLQFRTRGGPRPKAEPYEAYGPGGERLMTIVSVSAHGRRFSWSVSPQGDMSPPAFMGGGATVYEQVVKPADEPGVSGPVTADDNYLEHLRNCHAVPALRNWTLVLFRRLVTAGRLPAALELDEAGRVAPQHYEVVCRAFEQHLAQSGEFKYTLNLTRMDTHLDPIEDFVCNSRKGHCTRFATALALMLRAVGVPSRVVLGYRGFEPAGDGVYDVLQCHAHSWVEALVQRPGANPGETTWRWLTLDPTPTGDDADVAEFSWGQWWEYTRQGMTTFFKNFIIDYDADQQERAKYAVSQSSWWSIAGSAKRLALGPAGDDWGRAALLGACVLASMWGARAGVRRWRSRPAAAPDSSVAFYHRLLAVLRRALGLEPRTGQTPGEFAADAAARLRGAAATVAVAGVPGEAAVLYYRVRFGHRPLAVDERRAVAAQLDRLEAALTPPAGR